MPTAALHPCAAPGCSTLVSGRPRCPVHWREKVDISKARFRRLDEHRGSAHARGYDHEWERRRNVFLAQRPLCEHCQERGTLAGSSIADHLVPHKGDRALFCAADNLQALCGDCHRVKTLRESGLIGCSHARRVEVQGHPACAHCGRWL
jgi:5-methylcytosine-specific restriction protein A